LRAAPLARGLLSPRHHVHQRARDTQPEHLAHYVQAAVSAGNLLYDAKRYAEAIPFYQQAMAIDPRNVNVSTNLGTAL
jgi:tetratricopeptide (TPR) repeat protein